MEYELYNKAKERLRTGDLHGAARLVQEGLMRCRDRDASPETWSLRIIWASFLRLGGKTEEALEYLTSKEALYPPSSNDIASIVGLKNRVGHCLVMLGRFVSAHDHLRRAERMAREEGLAELL